MKSLSLALILILGSPVQAIEPQNPLFLCERFIEGPERTECEERMTKLKPDWYLATVCNKNFDDKSFYDCTELTKLGGFAPDKLDSCVGDEHNDSSRINCVKAALTKPEKAFQPATLKPAAKKAAPKTDSKKPAPKKAETSENSN